MNMITTKDVGLGSFWDYINQLERQLSGSRTTSYPPYNIIRYSETSAAIEFAVAGISPSDLTVTVHPQPQKFKILEVECKQTDREIHADNETNYEHRGIAQRSFKSKIPLSEGWEVDQCHLENGMLTVHLVRVVPEEQKPFSIKIQYH